MIKKLLLSCFAIFGLTFFLSSNSYAVSDVSVTYNSVPSNYQDVFPTCTGDCLNDYSYLIVHINSPDLSSLNVSNMFYIRFDGSTERNFGISLSSYEAIYELPFDGHSNNYLSFRQNLPFDIFQSGITFTLTESYQSGITPEGTFDITSNGTFDVTNYASVVVDIPTEEVIEDPISNDFQKVFFAIVEKIIPAFGVILVVWFGIDMLSSLIFGRGR